MSAEFPWPEEPERVERRIRGMVESLLRPDELEHLRLDWVVPAEPPPGYTSPGWVVLRATVYAKDEEVSQHEIWGPDAGLDWEGALAQLANDLEGWVCETPFAWGEHRRATVPS